MRYQIINRRGNVVDRNLSYDEALMYIDSTVGKFYTMKPMKDDQNDELEED